ncbi:hypothetical protein N9N28_10100 [Rubripirellula amarantea]|nr:hypothetical protein [Rubripirellula amarantea]
MDKITSTNKPSRRLTLAAIIACSSCVAGATEFDSNLLLAVPESDVISFRSPDYVSGVAERTETIAQTGATLADLISGSATASPSAQVAPPSPIEMIEVRDNKKSESKPVEVHARRTAPPQLRSFLVDDPAGNLPKNSFSLPPVSPVIEQTSESMRPYIAPESLAEMVRVEKPQVKADAHSLSLHNEDADALFPLPSMEVFHAGNPVQQDALTIKNPGFRSASTGDDLNGMIDAISEKDYDASLSFDDRARRAADNQGFEMFAVQNLEPPEPNESLLESGTPNITAAIHANRLRELSAISLRDARSRLQRRATHSARKYAHEGLRLAIDVEDSLQGTNQHMRDLQVALAAIRESKDFGGIVGNVDTRTMQRMVAVHETESLKNKDLTTISSIRATEIYLDVARKHLITAGAGSPLAAEAMLLLGLIEKQMPDQSDAHSVTVCLTYQGAAAEVAPNSPGVHREYGKTLLQQGLAHQAVESLQRSVALRPTRGGYQSLLEASRRIGNVALARQCLNALDEPQLVDSTPVRQLPPGEFAASYRPTPATMSPDNTKGSSGASSTKRNGSQGSDSTEHEELNKNRVGFRSLFSFGRR